MACGGLRPTLAEMGQGDGVAPLAEDGTLDVNDKAEQQICAWVIAGSGVHRAADHC